MPSAARVLAVHLRSGCCRQRDAGAAAGAKGTSRLITRLLRATGGGTSRTDACRIGLVPGGVFVPFIALQFRRTRLNHAGAGGESVAGLFFWQSFEISADEGGEEKEGRRGGAGG